MTDNYARIYPSFWTGETGRRLRQESHEVRLAAIWLLSNRHAHPTGVYYLPLPLLAHEVGISPLEGASMVLHRLSEAGFCHYDGPSETVWIPEMAAHQIGKSLTAGDKRRPWVISELERIRKTPFYNDFLRRYATPYNIDASPLQAPPMPLASPSDAIPHSAFRIQQSACSMSAAPTNRPSNQPPELSPAPPNPDSFHATALLVEAGLTRKQADKFTMVYGLPYATIRREVEAYRGKPTGVLVWRLQELATAKGQAATATAPAEEIPEWKLAEIETRKREDERDRRFAEREKAERAKAALAHGSANGSVRPDGGSEPKNVTAGVVGVLAKNGKVS